MNVVRAALALMGVAVRAGCTPGVIGGAVEQERATPGEVPAGPRCVPDERPDVLARFPGVSCPWLLLSGPGGGVRLESTAAAQPKTFDGVPPDVCRDPDVCRFGGQETALGPVILAVELSPHSEVPHGVHFGAVSGPSSLDFIDLWAGGGPQVMAEGTPVGPAFFLAPAACGSDLGLVVTRRLPGAESISAPETLEARAGIYRAEEGRWTLAGTLPESCVRLNLSLP